MLQSFFILCSGADKNLLEGCSQGEKTKFVGIGATVFFTAVMAFLASAYALFTVFDSVYPAIAFGLVWSLLIFNLDRFIVSTIRKRDKLSAEFLQATPRILLAIIIAIVISKPLEIKIFEKEINTVLLKEKNAMALKNKKEVADYFKTDLDKNKAEIMAVFEQCYGADQAAIWFQRWRMFYMACAELFGFDEGREWLVGHYRFVRV